MTTAPESVAAVKLLADVDAAQNEARPDRRPFNPVIFMDALHRRGWAITAIEPIEAPAPTQEEPT